MAEIIPFSMCHTDLKGTLPPSGEVRIPRPLRDLLRTSGDGIVPACRRAWTVAATAPGEWMRPNITTLLGRGRPSSPEWLALRSKGDHLHLQMGFEKGVATAIGRRLIVRAKSTELPATIGADAVGQPLARLLSGPFLDDPALIVQRLIQAPGGAFVDIRCRCPSHTLAVSPRHSDEAR